MSTGHPRREPDWLYDKAQRQIKRREDLAEYERLYRKEAGLPEGPLDLLDHVGLELALKTYELFMDRVFWGEGTGEMMGFQGVSPLQALVRRQGRVDEDGPRRLGVPRQEVNLSRAAMDLLARALDTTLEHYGTSGDADPRGYWMPIDGDTR